MRIAITGGTGFVGTHLTRALLENGDEVILFTRSPEKVPLQEGVTAIKFPLEDESDAHGLDVGAVINLAGDSINQRWTKQAKSKILNSRVQTTRELVELIKQKKLMPKVMINASAIGYYGTAEDERFTEESPPGNDFLANVVQAWEEEAEQVQALGVRLIKARFGLVLGGDGGALPKMILPYRFYGGGKLGSGKQWVSWIHIVDIVGLMLFALEHDDTEGALNCTAPQPVRMNDLGKTIGKTLNKPHLLPAPSFAIKLMLGEMSILLLKGQHVHPKKALQKGYVFKYDDVEQALKQLLS